jgi:hypothetical protein
LLEKAGLLRSNSLLTAIVGQQRFLKLRKNVIRNLNILQNRSQSISQSFFPNVREVALSSKLRATVINVFALLDFRRHFAIVVSTGE